MIVTGCLVVVGVVAVGLVVLVGDRTPTRSTEAFCSTMKAEQKRILDDLQATTDEAKASGDDFTEVLMTLTASIQALGELDTYFRKLAKVAPEEIQTETELVSDKIGELLKVPDLSVEGIAGSLIAGIELNGPLTTINDFAVANCGRSV